jgi:O-antigen/teichoic acid export membrane protein
LKEYIKKILPKNRFARSVSILAGGTAFSQGLTILASPFLTRLYSPDDFGLLAVYVSLLGILGVIASLRYEMAIPLPENDEDAASVIILCLFIVLGMSALSCVAVFFFKESIVRLMNAPALGDFLWLLPVGLLLMGIYRAFNYWAIRNKAFTAIARTKLTQSITNITIQLAGYSLGPIALLFGQIAAQAAGSTSLGMLAVRGRWATFRLVRFHKVTRAACRYKRFPLYSSWAGLINTAGHQLPPILFVAFFSASAAGVYALAHRVLMLPATLIGVAIGNVFFSHASEENRKGDLKILYAKVQDKLIQIGLPPALILIAAGPELFATIFGEDWRIAGQFSQWLAVGAFAGFVVSPLSMVLTILEKQDVGFILQAILFVARLIAILIGALMDDLLIAVGLFSIASFFGYSIYIIMMSKYTQNRFKDYIKSLLVSGLYSSIAVLPIYISHFFDSKKLFYVALTISAITIFMRYKVISKENLENL